MHLRRSLLPGVFLLLSMLLMPLSVAAQEPVAPPNGDSAPSAGGPAVFLPVVVGEPETNAAPPLGAAAIEAAVLSLDDTDVSLSNGAPKPYGPPPPPAGATTTASELPAAEFAAQDQKPDATATDTPVDAVATAGVDAVEGWSTVMSEGFEGAFPVSPWRTYDNDGTTNGEYYWDDTSYKAYAGSWSGWVADGGANALSPWTSNYPNYARSWMVYGPFNLSNATDAELLFNYWNQSESNYDFLYWMASVDGRNFYGQRVSGDSGGWSSVNFDLTNVYTLGNLAGRSSVWIAFIFNSDYSVTYKGAFVDNVRLQKYTTTATCPGQYKAEYFNNRTLSGSPTFTRCEGWPISHNWGSGGPGGGLGSDNFSVRWTGSAPIGAGTWIFTGRADDGIRAWLNNSSLFNGWIDQAATSYNAVRALTAGTYTVKVEYYEYGGGALAEFRWMQHPDLAAARAALLNVAAMRSPWTQVTSPPISFGVGARNAVLAAAMIDQFEVTRAEYRERYQSTATTSDTKCNIFAGDVMRAMQAQLPTKGELGVGSGTSRTTDPMTANARNLNEFLNGQRTSSNPANSGWRRIDPTTPQGLAELIHHLNEGRPAVASTVGHIAVLRPSQQGITRWQDLRIAQAGLHNFLDSPVWYGFGTTTSAPQFFIHD